MSEAKDKREKFTHENPHEINGISKDPLRRRVPMNRFPRKFEEIARRYGEDEDDEEEIELSLGLSLNGRFGVDPKRAKLNRSSSIPDFLPAENVAGAKSTPATYAPLVRTCSLPTETEEWWKRKDIQSLRRLEAKRKRLEKLKNGRTRRDREEICEENDQKGLLAIKGHGGISPEFGACNGASGTTGACFNGQGFELKRERGNGFEGFRPLPSGQGSIGSLGSGSSGNSESECPPAQGRNQCSEAGRLGARQANEKQGLAVAAAMEIRSVKSDVVNNEAKQMLRNMLLDMPYVSTTGDGPNGKRIEGFLYRYRKGEEVRIVCVCHGSFLSPAEFIKHAGGYDVPHPLRHIVVNPSPLL